MNDKTSYPGDITFDDGVARTSDGYYLNPTNTTSTAVSNSRGCGLRVGFAPGTILEQMASSSPTGGRAYEKLLVHGATTNYATAQSSASAANPVDRLIYVNTTPPAGGGAIELTIPSDSWVIYACQGPEASWNLYAQAFRTRAGKREVLLVNQRDRPIAVALPGAATWEYVDQSTASGPAASTSVKGSVTLNGLAAGVATLD